MKATVADTDRLTHRIEKLILQIGAALNEDPRVQQDLADLKQWGKEMGRLARRLPGDAVKGDPR